MTQKKIYTIDGTKIDSIGGFYEEVSRVMIPNVFWGRNLDAFNDILRGGFGTPEGGFTICLLHAGRLRKALGSKYDAIIRIIREHGPGGAEGQDGVDLILD